MRVMKKTVICMTLALVMICIMLSNTTASATSFGDWKQLGSYSSPYAEIWGRVGVKLSDHHQAEAWTSVFAAYQDSSGWHGVPQQTGNLRAWAQIYENYSLMEAVGWNTNNKDSYLVWAMADTPVSLGNYYYAKGWGQYFYYGNYYPTAEVDYRLPSTPVVHYNGTAFSPQNGLTSQSTAAYLRACGVTEFTYGLTSGGETYGTALLEDVLGVAPDWIYAKASNGEYGYIDADDYWVPMPTCPAEVTTLYSERQERRIPVYAEPGGGEIVGYFGLAYGGFCDTEQV